MKTNKKLSEPGEHHPRLEAVGRHGVNSAWKDHPPDRDSHGGIKPFSGICYNFPETVNLIAIPVLEVVREQAQSYEARSPGKIVIVSRTNANERAQFLALRPENILVELGAHPGEGDWNLQNRITCQAEMWLSGKPIGITGRAKLQKLQALVRQHKVTQMITHMQYPWLGDLAHNLEVELLEDYHIYATLGTKSGLNRALAVFQETHPWVTIGQFGVVFESREELLAEVYRLRRYGAGAYIKLDINPEGVVNAGGEGQLAILFETPEEKIPSLVDSLLERISDPSGVVQILVPEHFVMSITSGQTPQGYEIYEAHLQSQYGATADGAQPLVDNNYSQQLLNSVWPATMEFYAANGVTGRQNMNFIVIPSETLALARILYQNQNLGPIQPIDFNYRGMAGTANAMYAFREQIGQPVDLQNFRSRGLRGIHPIYTTDISLIYAQAAEIGLKVGPGGNLVVVNAGNLWPFQANSTKAQLIVSGTTQDPEILLEELEVILSEPPTMAQLSFFRSHYSIQPIQLDQNHYDPLLHTQHIVQNIENFLRNRG